MERTLIILKPDAIEKNVDVFIYNRIEEEGFRIIDSRHRRITREQAYEHYDHCRKYDFFEEMIDYITSGICMFIIAEKENAIEDMRKLIGPTRGAGPGTIRGDYGSDGYRNLIHASDSKEAFEAEMKRFFG